MTNTKWQHRALSLMAPLLVQCAGSGGDQTQDSFSEPEDAYNSWPNDSTTRPEVSEISSKILVADLNGDNRPENVFISQLPASTRPKSFVLRVTQGFNFTEISNYTSTRVSLLKDSYPFALDIDGDGTRELFFADYNKEFLIAIGFKDGDLKQPNIKWAARLPAILPDDFDRQLMAMDYGGRPAVGIHDSIVFEDDNRKPNVKPRLSGGGGGDDDSGGDD